MAFNVYFLKNITRMVTNYLFTQPTSVNMSVNLSGRNLFMPQHALYGTQVGSAFKQMCGK